jgi:UDP-glucose 4-epimerase
MSEILVTGGCGFIGANLVRKLSRDGWKVKVLDNLSIGRKGYITGISNVNLLQGDVTNKEDLTAALEGCGAVVHLAAQPGVADSIKDPWRNFQVNVGGFLNLLIACHEKGVKKVVFASSNAALGNQEMPINETKVPHPISPYGAAKLACEGYASTFSSTYGVKTVVLRFANVYGPYSRHKQSAIHKFIGRAIKGEPLEIYGDGEQTRDFIHVDDISQAIVLALEKDIQGVFQIGTGTETPLARVTELIRDISGGNSAIGFKPARKGDMKRNYSDISKARELGYEPKISIEQGLEQVYRWYKKVYE